MFRLAAFLCLTAGLVGCSSSTGVRWFSNQRSLTFEGADRQMLQDLVVEALSKVPRNADGLEPLADAYAQRIAGQLGPSYQAAIENPYLSRRRSIRLGDLELVENRNRAIELGAGAKTLRSLKPPPNSDVLLQVQWQVWLESPDFPIPESQVIIVNRVHAIAAINDRELERDMHCFALGLGQAVADRLEEELRNTGLSKGFYVDVSREGYGIETDHQLYTP